jgi:hypothetical protein
MKITDLDVIFISYDEPNAEINYADLCNKVPWAKRVHGIKGSDAAHKAAANLSESDWLITVDADNIVNNEFFNLEIDLQSANVKVFSWLAKNNVNGLMYGNGGLKIWKKEFILNMKTHEESTSERAQVDFCWEDGYRQFFSCYSETVITGTPFQAWRAGFREGVKMTLVDGVRVPSKEIQQRVWWHNLHRLKIWSTIGAHVENGIYSVLGARLGNWMANCSDWNYVDVRDFEILKEIYETQVNHNDPTEQVIELGEKLKLGLGISYPFFDTDSSRYMHDTYLETINLARTYYKDV